MIDWHAEFALGLAMPSQLWPYPTWIFLEGLSSYINQYDDDVNYNKTYSTEIFVESRFYTWPGKSIQGQDLKFFFDFDFHANDQRFLERILSKNE